MNRNYFLTPSTDGVYGSNLYFRPLML